MPHYILFSCVLYFFRETVFGICSRNMGSRDSVVGIKTGYGLDDRGVGVRVPVKVKLSLCYGGS
jgi:hypothetical protein